MSKLFYVVFGWLIVRPIRYLFVRMIAASCGVRWLPVRHEYFGWRMPNIHWWILYKTLFKFFKWLDWEAWRYFCDWTGGYRRSYPLIARAVHWLGSTTAGFAISGGRCFHCGSEEGDPMELSDGESHFELTDSGAAPTMDGTDYWFRGITTCPKCGYKDEYSDGSL